MREMQRLVEQKVNNAWVETFRETDENKIWESRAKDLIAKKLHKATWIRSVRDSSNYDGTRDITVYYDNGVRSIYTVKY